MSDYAVMVEMLGAEPGSAVVNELPAVTINHRSAGPTMLTLGTFSGGHVLHLAVAACVFNDLMREARSRGIRIERLAVTANGDFAGDPLRSTGITYTIDIGGDAPEEALRALVAHVERIAEIPDMLRHGMTVSLTEARIATSASLPGADDA
jgi:putative redox protein